MLALFASAAPASSQTAIPPVAQSISLAGPRVGFTFLSPAVVEKLKESSVDIGAGVSQFGWQFERRFYSSGSGLTAVTEWVVLIGGIEQGVMLPSLSWLVGLRTTNGAEVGIGPNVTPVGSAVAIAAGMTFRTGALNIPVNVAIVPAKSGIRVSLLTGFNTRR